MLGKIFGGAVAPCNNMIKEGAVVVDVRTPQEFAVGHVPGSVNVPIDEIYEHVERLRLEGKPLVLCCASGMRSARATRILKGVGVDACNGGSWKSIHV
jgi:rhodanese-related sulfurtransferase